MERWIKDIYKQVLKQNNYVKCLAAFPAKYTDHFIILAGDWKQSKYFDERYMDIQDYIDAKNGKKKVS